MDKRNDKTRDLLGVTAWHEAGYTGKRGRSASGEDFAAKPKDHPGWTHDAFKEIAPDREVICVEYGGDNLPQEESWKRLASELQEKGVDSWWVSINIRQINAEWFDPILAPVSGFCSLFNSIGNEGPDSYSTAARSAYIHGVGAIMVDGWGDIVPEGFTSVSPYVDFAVPDMIYLEQHRMVTEGTSFSAAVLCAMAALVNDFFIDKTGVPLTNEAMYRFFKDNSVDLLTEGRDEKTGWGYVVLPPPESVDILKYAKYAETPQPEPEAEESPAPSLSALYGKTASGLCEYAKAQLGKPYWFGTFGQTATSSLHASKKAQYPGHYTAADFPSQYGQRVHDCAGLIKGYLFSDTPASVPRYNAAFDRSADEMFGLGTRNGPIDTMPKIPGVLVHMPDHVGVYVGGGEVIEARGHAWGVVKTALTDRPWTKWSVCPWIVYDTSEEVKEEAGMRYNTLDEVPDWGKSTVKKLTDAKALAGTGEGLDLSSDLLRTLVILDRLGLVK